jgi:hypothetical protein
MAETPPMTPAAIEAVELCGVVEEGTGEEVSVAAAEVAELEVC